MHAITFTLVDDAKGVAVVNEVKARRRRSSQWPSTRLAPLVPRDPVTVGADEGMMMWGPFPTVVRLPLGARLGWWPWLPHSLFDRLGEARPEGKPLRHDT